jgi:hypothetical protein
MIYATIDNDGIDIERNANIRKFATLAEARDWLLSCYDEYCAEPIPDVLVVASINPID